MFKNHFKIAIRQLFKNKTFSIINILGLAVGMAAFILLVLYIQNEISYDKFHAKKDRIYSLWNKALWGNQLECMEITPKIAAKTIQQNIPGVENTARVDWPRDRLFVNGDKKILSSGLAVDANFLKLFDFPLLSGNINTVLNEPHSILVTPEFSKKIFGDKNPIGKTIKIQDDENVIVTGVIQTPPTNSRFVFEYLLSWKYTEIASGEDVFWGNNSTNTYVLIKENASLNIIQDKIKDLRKNYATVDTFAMFLYPLERWNLHSNFENGIESGGKITTVRILAVIAAFLLLIACINFMNLSTARGDKRAKEVGIRKTVGALKKTLIFQFLSETLVVAFISYLIALLLVHFCLPAYNTLLQKHLSIHFDNPLFWMYSLGFIIFIGFFAGSYPAFYLSSYNPIQVLKGTYHSVGKKINPRKVLVVTQFVFAIVLIISTLIIKLQISHVINREIGYNGNNLIYHELSEDLKKNYEVLKNDLLSQNLAAFVSKTSSPFTQCWSSSSSFWWTGKSLKNKTDFNRYCVDDGVIKTGGLTLIQGRDFDLKNYSTDSSAVIINESAFNIMGFKNPIGQIVKDGEVVYHIIGVIKDFIIDSPFKPTKPMMVFGATSNFLNVITIRIKDNKTNIKKIEALFKKYNPQYPLDLKYTSQQHNSKFEDIKQSGYLASLFAGITIFISCLGLFGLATFMAEKRTKEIGIRKTLGASVFKITKLLSFDFIKLVIIAFIIASPIAWWIMNNWLQDYFYKINISVWIFISGGAIAILIALLTVSIQAIKAATANPIKSLRTE